MGHFACTSDINGVLNKKCLGEQANRRKRAMWFIFVLEVLHYATATDSTGSGSLAAVKRATSFGPDFSGPIENVTAPVGREVALTCSVTELRDYKVGWMRVDDGTILSLNKRVITQNPRISVTHDNNLRTWQLRIRQLKESDRGCYMCQINTNPLKKQLGCVDVQVSPDIDDTRTSSDKSVTEGDNATLTCEASGHPRPRILWKREDGNRILLQDKSQELREVENLNGSVLNFFAIHRKQMGAYLCIATNDVPPTVSKRIVLTVKYPPSVQTQKASVGALPGTNAKLECEVDAFPNSNNYWVKDLHHINGTKYRVQEKLEGRRTIVALTVFNVSGVDFGSYSCVSRNSLGEDAKFVTLFEIEMPTTTTRQATETTSSSFPWYLWNGGETKSVNLLDNVTQVADISDNFLHPSLAPRQMELEILSNGSETLPDYWLVSLISVVVIAFER